MTVTGCKCKIIKYRMSCVLASSNGEKQNMKMVRVYATATTHVGKTEQR